MNNKMIKAYLARAEEIIGERTADQIAYDDAVVATLNQGYPIQVALAVAAAKHPREAIQWTPQNLEDIAAHYDYLKEHAALLDAIRRKRK